MMDNKTLTTHLPRPLADKVDAIAIRMDRSSDWVVKQALTAWVEKQEDRYQATLEALADVDGGMVADHKAVEDWAKSLSVDHK